MSFAQQLFILLAFIAVVSALEAAYLLWQNRHGSEHQRLQRRLRAMTGDDAEAAALLRPSPESASGPLASLVRHLPGRDRLARLIQQAGVRQSPADILLFSLLAGGAACLTAWLSHLAWPFVAGGGVVAASLPGLRLLHLRRQRQQRLAAQLPDALDLMGRALRAGHAFPVALGMVGTECAEPIAGEFRLTTEEINFGVPLATALLNLGRRVPSADLAYFIIAVLLQRETGGNLAELLANLSGLIRARFKLFGTIRTLSAEGRLSAWILGLLPFLVAGILQLINPGLMSVLWQDPRGLLLVQIALAMMVVGVLWMWRIVQIRV